MESDPSRIKVVHLVTRMNTGGVAVLISELVSGLRSGHVEVQLITGTCSIDEENFIKARGLKLNEISIPTMQRALNPIRDLSAFLAILKTLRKIRPDIVHTHTSKAGILGRLAAKIALPNVIIIHTFHGHLLSGYFSKKVTGIVIALEKFLARLTDVLVAMGNEVKTNLLEASIGKSNQFKVAFPGVNEAIPNLENSRVKEFFAQHEQDQIFTFVGRLNLIKRCDRIIELAREVKDEYPNIHFLIIGDGELREALEQESIGLPITFLGWESNSEDWLAYSDCGLLLSDNEAVPLAMIEAGLAGLPVIATNVGAMSDVVVNGVNGFLVKPTIAEIKSAVVTLAGSPELRKKFGKMGKKMASDKFSVDAMIKRHKEIYSQAIQNRR